MERKETRTKEIEGNKLTNTSKEGSKDDEEGKDTQTSRNSKLGIH